MRLEVKGLKEVREALDPKRYKKVVTRVLNKLGSQSKTIERDTILQNRKAEVVSHD